MEQTPWLDDDEQALWRLWIQVTQDVDALLARQVQADNNMSMADYVVLVNLTEAPDGRLRASELADRLNWERSRLSHHIARMEKRGLVQRQDCKSDRRGSYVAVTGAGRDLLAGAAPGHVRMVRRLVFDALDESDRGQLGAVLARMAVAVAAVKDANPQP